LLIAELIGCGLQETNQINQQSQSISNQSANQQSISQSAINQQSAI